MRASRPLLFGVAIVVGVAAFLFTKLATRGTPPPDRKFADAQSKQDSVSLSKPRYETTAIGAAVEEFGRPLVTNLQLVDLDRDGLLDVVYCEARNHTVRWIRQATPGEFTEHVIGSEIPGPAHVWPEDINRDGLIDVLVASMGQITPSNAQIGAVVILENLGQNRWNKRTIIDGISRVSDVRAADFDDDGRPDLVVGQFGYDQGEIRWMRNDGDWKFTSHKLLGLSGTVHTPVADFDGDGQPDIAALVSQEWEEVHLFRNLGNGGFRDTVVWGSTNEDYGSSGLVTADVDQDGDLDLVYTNGDGFDYSVLSPRKWHGIQWFENRAGTFNFHRVGDMPGAYGPCAADLDGNGTIDLLAVSGFANFEDPDSVSLMAWMNDGRQNFTPVVLAHLPPQMVAAKVGDFDGDGRPEIVTGGFHAFPPYTNMSNITLWRRK